MATMPNGMTTGGGEVQDHLDEDYEDVTAQRPALSPIGSADAVQQWPHSICSGPIEYHKANNYDGFVLCDAMHGIPTFGSVVDASKPTIRGQSVRVFNYPRQTEAIAKQLVDRWNSHDELLSIVKDALRSFKCTQKPSHYPADHWSNRALAYLHREAISEGSAKPEAVTPNPEPSP
jgi:hypothetical protein